MFSKVFFLRVVGNLDCVVTKNPLWLSRFCFVFERASNIKGEEEKVCNQHFLLLQQFLQNLPEDVNRDCLGTQLLP